jgi:Fur family transcriptional regulator, stress-responsive regulator
MGDNKHRLACRSCGRTADVDCDSGGRRCLGLSAIAGYEFDQIEVAFWGLCSDCQWAEQPTQLTVLEKQSSVTSGQ